MKRGALLFSTALAFAVVPACGGSGDSVFPTATPSGSTDSGSSEGGLFGDGGTHGHSTSDGSVTDACAQAHAAAALAPSYLVFVMDRSDSMAQDSKWVSCSAALSAFFTDPTTSGLNASLTWLPEVQAGTQSTSKDPTFLCTSSNYTMPDVALSALPNAAFATAIAAQKLQFGTPTLAAFEGAATQAQAVAQAHAGAKVIVVLATDGLPYGCTGNTVQTVSDAAATLAAAGTLTYVIGVGSALSNLDAIAKAGGTNQAFVVPTNSPSQTEQAFLDAIKTIQGTLACSYSIPMPPSGQTIDYGEVNVVYTPSGGQGTTLTYSADCSNVSGWHYDNPQQPTTIELCMQACTQAQTEPGAKMDIVFGCATNGGMTN